jgi:hypothetical protein
VETRYLSLSEWIDSIWNNVVFIANELCIRIILESYFMVFGCIIIYIVICLETDSVEDLFHSIFLFMYKSLWYKRLKLYMLIKSSYKSIKYWIEI